MCESIVYHVVVFFFFFPSVLYSYTAAWKLALFTGVMGSAW
jgi:hypothetical protein